jgi:hypothetical protein
VSAQLELIAFRGFSGAEIEKYHRDGHIREIADYCKSDVLNTYRVWLRYELFRGRLSEAAFQTSEDKLVEFIEARARYDSSPGSLVPQSYQCAHARRVEEEADSGYVYDLPAS